MAEISILILTQTQFLNLISHGKNKKCENIIAIAFALALVQFRIGLGYAWRKKALLVHAQHDGVCAVIHWHCFRRNCNCKKVQAFKAPRLTKSKERLSQGFKPPKISWICSVFQTLW